MPFDANGNWTQVNDGTVQVQGGSVPGATGDWHAQFGGSLMPADATEQGGWNGPGVGLTDPGQRGQVPPGGGGGDWFGQYAPGGGAVAGGGPAGSADTSWWNPADPKGSIAALFGGQPPSSQTILALAPQLNAAGIQISPPNAEGVTSKINIPGVGWTRILEGGVAGGQGTGWNFVPQGTGAGGGGGGSPYGTLGGGTTPLSDLAAGPNPLMDLATQAATGLESSPGYQFRLGQGQQALERGAAAKGTLLTGGTAKALDRYGQDFASTEYQNRLNQLLGIQAQRYGQLSGEQAQRAGQLMNLSQLGLNATGTQANLGSTYAGQTGNILNSQATGIGDVLTGAGNAQAASTIAQGNAWAQGLSGVGTGVNNALQMYYLSKLYGGGATPSNAGTPTYGYGAPTTPGPYGSGYQFPTAPTVPPYLAQ